MCAATAGRVQWVDVERLCAALAPLSTAALDEAAETYTAEAAEARRLHGLYVAAIKAAQKARWGKGASALKVMDLFKWIPDDGLRGAADFIDDDDSGGGGGAATPVKKREKKKAPKGKQWKGWGTDVYYQPRSHWPPLSKEARRAAREREREGAAGRFRPWVGDTVPWEPDPGVLGGPMRDLTLINQPHWRDPSPHDPSLTLDRSSLDPRMSPPRERHLTGDWQPRRPQSARSAEHPTSSFRTPRAGTPGGADAAGEWGVSDGKAIRLGRPVMWEATGPSGGIRPGGATRPLDALGVGLVPDSVHPSTPGYAWSDRGSGGDRPEEEEGSAVAHRGFRRRAVI